MPQMACFTAAEPRILTKTPYGYTQGNITSNPLIHTHTFGYIRITYEYI